MTKNKMVFCYKIRNRVLCSKANICKTKVVADANRHLTPAWPFLLLCVNNLWRILKILQPRVCRFLINVKFYISISSVSILVRFFFSDLARKNSNLN